MDTHKYQELQEIAEYLSDNVQSLVELLDSPNKEDLVPRSEYDRVLKASEAYKAEIERLQSLLGSELAPEEIPSQHTRRSLWEERNKLRYELSKLREQNRDLTDRLARVSSDAVLRLLDQPKITDPDKIWTAENDCPPPGMDLFEDIDDHMILARLYPRTNVDLWVWATDRSNFEHLQSYDTRPGNNWRGRSSAAREGLRPLHSWPV